MYVWKNQEADRLMENRRTKEMAEENKNDQRIETTLVLTMAATRPTFNHEAHEKPSNKCPGKVEAQASKFPNTGGTGGSLRKPLLS